MDEIQRGLLMSKIQRIESPKNQIAKNVSRTATVDFDQILDHENLKVSKHAEKRLAHRNIELSDVMKTQLTEAMGSLEQKGARDSLALSGDLAFIVNVPSRTLVTALTKDQMKDHVFTNIDSTLVMS